MAGNIIGFNSESDFDRMSRFVRKTESGQQVGRRNRRRYPVGTSRGREVRIRISDVDSGATPKTATAVILGYDRGAHKAPGQNDNGEITVIDRIGCNLVSPYDELLCKKGYARYMYDRSTEEKAWELVSLDCAGTIATACNIVEYPMNSTPSEELFFYDRFVDDLDIGILVIRSQIIGGAGINYTSGCVWQTPRYPNGVDEAEIGTNQFIEFLKSGRSIVIAGEQENRPADYFGGLTYDPCIDQTDCDAINDFYASIGGVSTMSPADLAPPEPATDFSGVHCFTGGIAADGTHRFCVDDNGDQNVFYFSVRGSAKVTAGAGGTEFAYVWDSVTGTDSSNCLMAGNQYNAPNAGWLFMVGDADMVDSESCYGPDMTTFFDNLCRHQNCLNAL